MPSSDDESLHFAEDTGLALKRHPDVVAPSSMDICAATSTQPALDNTKQYMSSPPKPPTQGFLHRTSGSSAFTPNPHTKLNTFPAQPRGTPKHKNPGSLSSPDTREQNILQFQHRKAHMKTNRHSPTSHDSPISTNRSHGRSVEKSQWTQALQSWTTRHKDQTDSELSDQIRDVIEDVIERHCHGASSEHFKLLDESSFQLSLHSLSDSGGSAGWDDTIQVSLGVAKTQDKNLACLMQVHINVEDQMYKSQLDTALNNSQEGEGADQGAGPQMRSSEHSCSGHVNNTNDEVLPDLPHIPQSFVGKTWMQVMHEDDLKVNSMVKEFREGHFLCYFDSESLAKFGRHQRKRHRKGHEKKAKSKGCKLKEFLPLLDYTEDNVHCLELPQKQRPKGHLYRLASRCQVVKVSHATQTAPLFCPVIRQKMSDEASAPPGKLETCQDLHLEKTPDMKTRLCALKLPASYGKIMSPIQPKTVVYVLSSPDPAQSTSKSTPTRKVGRKRKSCDNDCTLKYKYKKTPLKYYDPLTNRILKTPPKGTSATPSPKPFVRQLFRSLSPDINKEKQGFEHGWESWGVQRARAGSSMADLCASTSGSCLDSVGPSEPGSSVSGSHRALFSRSSLSSSTRFVLGALTPTPSYTGSSRARATSCTSSSQVASTGPVSEKTGAPGVRGRPRRSTPGEKVKEKPFVSAIKSSVPPNRTRTVTSKLRPKVKAGNSVQRRPLPRKATEGKTSPRGKTSTRSSSRGLAASRQVGSQRRSTRERAASTGNLT
ncbi:DBF4-type zinc finger-containing protein 2 isoform X2 [Denticeps clupeoides]|nr:DBF4-type zinc finger-containing protein 2 isoform X2 [Denticeps clupeoides]XP_028831407.1 DBF4-type zinc finger-containing protein 2 isoform X2 [Denticeps clupeoides]